MTVAHPPGSRDHGAADPAGIAELDGHRVTVAGRSLFVRSADGASPHTPVLFLHGLVISSRSVVPTAVRLAGTRPVIAPDLPGCGRSPRPDAPLSVPQLADLAGHLLRHRGRPAIVVANSFGCQIAVELTIRHPASVRALVLAGPAFAPGQHGWLSLAAQWSLTTMREPSKIVPLAVRELRRTGLRQAAAHVRMGRRYPLANRLSRVTAPTLVVRGYRDHLAPAEWSRHLAQLPPQGRFAEVPGAHVLPYDSPEVLADLIEGVGRQVDAAVPGTGTGSSALRGAYRRDVLAVGGGGGVG